MIESIPTEQLEAELARRKEAAWRREADLRDRRAWLIARACETVAGFKDEFVGKPGTDIHCAVFGDTFSYEISLSAFYNPLGEK